MTIQPSTIARFAPHGNAVLAFEVSGYSSAIDEDTGNTIISTEVVEYLAALKLQAPQWQGAAGSDSTTYQATGRLLSPAVLDTRITNGSQAQAQINGYNGRFELVFDLVMDRNAYRDLRQQITGIFRVVGGPS